MAEVASGERGVAGGGSPVNYFVTGATGFIGRFLVERLLARGGTVYVLVRPGSRERLAALRSRWGVGPHRVDQRADGCEGLAVNFVIAEHDLEMLLDGTDHADDGHRVELGHRTEQRRIGRHRSRTPLQAQDVVENGQNFCVNVHVLLRNKVLVREYKRSTLFHRK